MPKHKGKRQKPHTYGTSKTPVKRNTKDSVFTHLFCEKKYLLMLYQALHPEDTGVSEGDLVTVTLENVLINGICNDLGFMVGGTLIILVEAQSTWSENIIIRMLLYVARSLQEYFARTKQSLYSSQKVAVPQIELYVIYTGDKVDHPDRITFTEEFCDGKTSSVDVTVKVLYNGTEGDILYQYIAFSKVFDGVVKQKGYTREAMLEVISICESRDILKEYLEGHREEVVDIMFKMYDEDELFRQFVVSERRQEREAATKAANLDFAKEMLADGSVPMDKIARFSHLSIDAVRQLAGEMQPA